MQYVNEPIKSYNVYVNTPIKTYNAFDLSMFK